MKIEIGNARAREDQKKRQMLFPIALVPFDHIEDRNLFDADRWIDNAREIREYFIPDFSNWKDHYSDQKSLGRLLRDLKAGVRDGRLLDDNQREAGTLYPVWTGLGCFRFSTASSIAVHPTSLRWTKKNSRST